MRWGAVEGGLGEAREGERGVGKWQETEGEGERKIHTYI